MIRRPMIVLECGQNGWGLLEYQEMAKCIREVDAERYMPWTWRSQYHRTLNISLMMVRRQSWLYFYSPRTEKDYKAVGAVVNIIITTILTRLSNGRLAFVLTDANQKALRRLALVSSCLGGKIYSVVSPGLLRSLGSGIRAKGPFIFQVSRETIEYVSQISEDYRYFTSSSLKELQEEHDVPGVRLVGGLYPERKAFFESTMDIMGREGIRFSCSYRYSSGERNTSEEYWEELIRCKYLVTTSFMTSTDNDEVSRSIGATNHFLYRFAEAFVAKRVLIVQEPFDCINLAQPGVHYIAVDSPNQVISEINRLEANPQLYARMVEAAFRNYSEVIESYGLINLALQDGISS